MALPQPRPGLMGIPVYVAGKSQIKGAAKVVKLSSNEAALGPSPKAVAAYADRQGALHRYPAGDSGELRAAIAEVHALPVDRIICGAGSDEILCLVCRAYAGPGDEIIHTRHGFLMYEIYARSVGADPVAVAERDLKADVDAILAAVTPRTRIVFLANPNNPTGTYLAAAEMKRLRDGLREDIVLVADEAYAEFMDAPDYESAMGLALATENTIVARTFSKIYGLASLRVGWGFAARSMIDALERVRSPFNVSVPAQAAATAAVRDQAHVRKAREHNSRWMKVAVQRLRGMGLKVGGAAGNFILPEFDAAGAKTAAAADAFLQSRGLIVRRVDNYGLPNHLRITIGADDEMEAVLQALGDFMEGRHG